MCFICIKDDNGIVVLPDLGGPEWFWGKVRFTLWKQLKTADFPPLTGLPLWFGYSKGSFFFTNFQSPIPRGPREKKILKIGARALSEHFWAKSDYVGRRTRHGAAALVPSPWCRTRPTCHGAAAAPWCRRHALREHWFAAAARHGATDADDWYW